MKVEFTVPGQPVAKQRPKFARMGRGHKKAADDEILAAYGRFGSCKGAASALGMCAQSVHERLVRLSANKTPNFLTATELETIRGSYQAHADAGTLSELAVSLGRTKQLLCRAARSMGMTNPRRTKPRAAAITLLQWRESHPHPRGMLGKKHTAESLEKISAKSREAWAKLGCAERDELVLRRAKLRPGPPNVKRGTWKAGWRDIGGVRKFFRSKWEANYARYLEWLRANGQILQWEHEPETFWFDGIKRGTLSYLPDFRVTELDGSIIYHEVKGWMDARSITKLSRMAKYHPHVVLRVVDASAYRAISKHARMIPGWE